MVAQTGGSPWDEPPPEEVKLKKPAPTVVGDLDVNKKQASPAAAVETKPAELKVPTDTDEKVGAKVDPSTVQPAVEPEPIAAPTPVPPPSIAPKPVPAPEPAAMSEPAPAKPVAPADITPKPAAPAQEVPTSDFWQSVYGQTDKPEEATMAKPQVSPSPATIADIQPQPQIPPAPTKVPVTNAPDIPSQSTPVFEPAPQVPLKPVPTSDAVGIPTGNVGTPTPPTMPPQTPGVPAAPQAKAPKSRAKIFIIAGAIAVVVLLAAGVFLTEQGIISFGLEKVYGAAHLEALWGGLPANAENAFAMSAVKMKSEKSFKISGTATITASKGTKSTIISPLVSAAALPMIALKDEQVGSRIAATLTAVDSNSLTTGDSTTTPSDTTNTPSSSTTGTGTTSTGSTSTSVSPTSTTTVEELSTDITAQMGDIVSGAKINVKSSKSPNSQIELVYSKNKMYLKTSSDIVYDSGAKDGWISFDIAQSGTLGPAQTLLASNFSGSNFSIVGSRGKSETINGVHCFHYSGKTNIGSALESFGLKENSLTSLDMDYWLGTRDHLIHRITMKIVSGAEAAVSRIDLTLDFSDFGSGATDFSVPATSTPYSGSTTSSGATPTPGQAATSTEKTRDTQRKADLANIAKALEAYHSANSKYPAAVGTEKISSSASSNVLASALVPKYLSTMPLDPKDPTYYYGYESTGTSYKLSAVLEDKTDPVGKTVGSNYLYFLSSL